MSEERDYRWYIVHTQHGYENKVRERLEKRILYKKIKMVKK